MYKVIFDTIGLDDSVQQYYMLFYEWPEKEQVVEHFSMVRYYRSFGAYTLNAVMIKRWTYSITYV